MRGPRPWTQRPAAPQRKAAPTSAAATLGLLAGVQPPPFAPLVVPNCPQAPAQGDVHVRRGERGARVSRHSRKPSPRMRARLQAETSALVRPHVWQSARRHKLPTRRPIAWFTVIRYSGRGRVRKDILPGRTLGPVALEQVASDGRLAKARGGSFVVYEELPHTSLRRIRATLEHDRQGIGPGRPVGGRRSACGTQETKAALARWKKSKAAGMRPSGAALAEERLQCAPDRMVMCFRICRRLGRRHGAEQVLRPRRGAKEEQQPGTLQVRQLRQLRQQALLLLQALPRARGSVLRGADGRAKGNKPTLGQRFVATPRLRAELRRRPGRDCRRAFCLATPASSSTAEGTASSAARARLDTVTIYKSSKKAARNSPGRSCWEAATSAACCARANRAGANASPCSQPSPCRMRWQAPAPSHHKYTDWYKRRRHFRKFVEESSPGHRVPSRDTTVAAGSSSVAARSKAARQSVPACACSANWYGLVASSKRRA